MLMVRKAEIAAVSLAAFLALTRLGIAIAAMMAMIATTIMSSMRVKPLRFCAPFCVTPAST